jgi:hypothetical protein
MTRDRGRRLPQARFQATPRVGPPSWGGSAYAWSSGGRDAAPEAAIASGPTSRTGSPRGALIVAISPLVPLACSSSCAGCEFTVKTLCRSCVEAITPGARCATFRRHAWRTVHATEMDEVEEQQVLALVQHGDALLADQSRPWRVTGHSARHDKYCRPTAAAMTAEPGSGINPAYFGFAVTADMRTRRRDKRTGPSACRA